MKENKNAEQWISQSGKNALGYFGVIFLFVQFMNILNHRSLLSGMDAFFGLGVFYGVSYGLFRLKLKRIYRFLLAFVLSFLLFTGQMILIDKSYVDYTSLIIVFIASLFVAGVMLLPIKAYEKRNGAVDK
jgi:hypothetical protein